MARSPELSEKLHTLIWDLWVYKNMGLEQIANHINGDTQLRSEFGEITKDGVYYHVVKIREELEKTVNEDALDSYVGEFIRAKEGLDADIQAVQVLIDAEKQNANSNPETLIKLMRLKHEIKVDRFKLLQDVELPIRVKKLKREREKLTNQFPVRKLELRQDGASTEGNIKDNQ